jgi:hypothetical protein
MIVAQKKNQWPSGSPPHNIFFRSLRRFGGHVKLCIFLIEASQGCRVDLDGRRYPYFDFCHRTQLIRILSSDDPKRVLDSFCCLLREPRTANPLDANAELLDYRNPKGFHVVFDVAGRLQIIAGAGNQTCMKRIPTRTAQCQSSFL